MVWGFPCAPSNKRVKKEKGTYMTTNPTTEQMNREVAEWFGYSKANETLCSKFEHRL
jgi:hypothetical protein